MVIKIDKLIFKKQKSWDGAQFIDEDKVTCVVEGLYDPEEEYHYNGFREWSYQIEADTVKDAWDKVLTKIDDKLKGK